MPGRTAFSPHPAAPANGLQRASPLPAMKTSGAPPNSPPVAHNREGNALPAERHAHTGGHPRARIFPFRLSWRWKVIVPLILLSVAGISGITWVSIRAQRSLLLRTAAASSSSVADSMAERIVDHQRQRSPEGMDQLLRQAVAEHTLRRAWLTDASGNIRASTTASGLPAGMAPLLASTGGQHFALNQHAVYTVRPIRASPPLVLVIQSSYENAAASERQLVRRIVLLALLGMVGSALVIYFLLMVLIDRPLQELRTTMRNARMKEWNMHVHFDRRKDEIGDLARYYNAMVDAFEQSCRACDTHYQLQLARSEHFATLGQVAAGLAHEVRNPLAGIAAALEVLDGEFAASDSRHEIMQEVQAQVGRIKGILTELLNYARPRPLQLTAGDLNATVEHVVEFSRAQARAVEIVFQPQPLPPITHDPDQMQRLLMNLVMNALDATRERTGDARVMIRTQRRPLVAGHGGGPTIQIEVVDNGRGIEPDEMEKIFRPFYTSRTPNGNGLGLSLCRRIAEMHQGRIAVRSTPGQGSIFTVELPERLAASPLPILQGEHEGRAGSAATGPHPR